MGWGGEGEGVVAVLESVRAGRGGEEVRKEAGGGDK